MQDESFLRGENSGTAGVVTLVLVVGAARSPGSGMVMAYARPSDGVRAAVTAVAEARGEATAAVTTAELSDEKIIADRLRTIVDAGPLGSVLVSLATQELSRSLLSSDFRFEDMTTVDVPSGGKERVFIVAHPSLTPPTSEPIRTDVEHRDGFIGREKELEDIGRRLDRARIVTVVGPSGIGKSALIRRYVGLNDSSFPDGVLEVDLSSVTQAAVVVPMLLRLSNAVRLPGESVLDALTAHMRERRSLLVMDNCEGVLPEVRRIVSALVRVAPNVAILIGSQRALRMPGEARVKVSGLETPIGVEAWRSLEGFDAVALFVDRAQLVEPDFEITKENGPIVAQICHRLDGIPLAIEMAASKVSILSPHQILHRLGDRFHLLKDPSPSRPDRHRTLRATIDWGHDQLRPDAKILLRRLAPFAGAFSIDEATEMAKDEKLPEDMVFGAFDELVEASLLTPSMVGGEEKRFYLNETVRLYAAEHLRKAEEDRVFNARHRAWCLKLAQMGQAGLVGVKQIEWLHRIDASYEDLRQAIEAEAGYRGDLDTAMETLIAIFPYYLHRTYHGEGLRMCEKVLAAPKAAKRKKYPRILNVAAILSARMGQLPEARRYAYHSYRIARKSRDTEVLGLVHGTMSLMAQAMGLPRRALRHHLAAAKAFRETGSSARLLNVLVNIITAEVDLKRLVDARQHVVEARALLVDYPIPVLEAYLHVNWSHLELADGNYDAVLDKAMRAANFLVDSGDQSALHTVWRNAAYALEALGRHQASAFFLGAARRLSKGEEHHIQPKYERDFVNLAARVGTHLGWRFQELEAEGFIASDEEIRERLEYESSK